MADGGSEMVERVARALEALCEHDGEPVTEMARAAIAAMREPTNEQRNRFFEMKRAAGGSETSSCFIDADWECAIDAALGKPPA